MVYQNETRLVGRPDVPVVITETGWCAQDDLLVSGPDPMSLILVVPGQVCRLLHGRTACRMDDLCMAGVVQRPTAVGIVPVLAAGESRELQWAPK